MDCSLVARELVAYHLDACDETTHSAMEEHLLECPACVRSYLLLKGAFRKGTALSRPSDEVRARIRRDVQKTFAPARRDGWWRAVKKPVPLYQTLGVALAAAALAVALPKWLSSHDGRGAWPGPYVDTSREVAERLTVY